jgi:hypothetical protein
MTDRRYTDDEIAAIFAAAAETPQAPPPAIARAEGLTLAQLQDIGREVGISSHAVAQAALALDLRGQGTTQTFVGLPIGVQRTVALDRWLTDREWEQLVVELRDVFHATGTVRSTGSLREWRNGNLHALLEPSETGHRLRLRTLKGDARSLMGAGLGVVGVAAAVAVATGLAGRLGAAVPGIAFLALAGLGMFASGALRVLSWARLRAKQMETIGARLALPSAPTSTVPPARDEP